jgi:glyoxylase-like metal-dependent hydrolase (beta-lactamase superfamily II)
VSDGAAELTPEAALEQAALAGIHCLPIGTPFAVGTINAYLIDDKPLTLIDAGPNSGKSLEDLNAQLARHGHTIDDLELILVTHQHLDHIGLVEIAVEHSGAEVGAIGAAARRLRNFDEEAVAEDEYAVSVMLRNGIPEDVAVALKSVSSSYHGWGSAVNVTRPLEDGETIEFGDRSLQALHRPGHSPSDTVFWDEERKLLWSGDHLLSNVSSNPLITLPLDGARRRVQTLVTYLDSLRKTQELPAEIVFGGHGEPITDHVALIDTRFAATERRKEKIYRLIAERSRSGYELAQAIWGNVAVTQAYLTLSEVIGHTDILVNEGRVREADDGSVIRFEAV